MFGISRQAYHVHQTKEQQTLEKHSRIIQDVLAIREKHPRMGSRKLHNILSPKWQKEGIKIGRDALFNLLANHKLLIRRRKRNPAARYSRQLFNKYQNLMKDQVIFQSNQVWVSDITYWKVNNKFLYIFLITDAYSRKIVGYTISENLKVDNLRKCLNMAISQVKSPIKGLIHHSDRGIQYCNKFYLKELETHGIQVSMADKGKSLDNALAERINGVLKHEYLFHLNIKNAQEAKVAFDQVVRLYNTKRPHLSCGMHTPEQVYTGEIIPVRLWDTSS